MPPGLTFFVSLELVLIPEDVDDGGQVFGYYGANDLMWNGTWTVAQGKFELNTMGDFIHLCCLKASGTPKPLLAFNYGGVLTAPKFAYLVCTGILHIMIISACALITWYRYKDPKSRCFQKIIARMIHSNNYHYKMRNTRNTQEVFLPCALCFQI
jgi:hypothetical protein